MLLGQLIRYPHIFGHTVFEVVGVWGSLIHVQGDNEIMLEKAV